MAGLHGHTELPSVPGSLQLDLGESPCLTRTTLQPGGLHEHAGDLEAATEAETAQP